jgi:hypothetical protein
MGTDLGGICRTIPKLCRTLLCQQDARRWEDEGLRSSLNLIPYFGPKQFGTVATVRMHKAFVGNSDRDIRPHQRVPFCSSVTS